MEPIQLAAVPVSSVDQEYAWLDRRFGRGRYRRKMQSLVQGSDRMYDRIDVVVDGKPYVAWFDISSFMPFIGPKPAGQVFNPSLPSLKEAGLALVLFGAFWFAYSSSKEAAEESSRKLARAREDMRQRGYRGY